MWIYPEVIESLSNSVTGYRNGRLSVESLQVALNNAADAIVAIEESWFRKALLRAESELELLRFTVDSDRVFQQSLRIIDDIEQAILRGTKG